MKEKKDHDSDKEIPLSLSPSSIHSFDLETTHIGSDKNVVFTCWASSSMFNHTRIQPMRSLHFVLLETKISMLLPFGPLAIWLHYQTKKDVWVFFFSLLGMIPLAERFRYIIEQLSLYTGPKVSLLLKATYGNVPEMTISVYALKNGMTRVVQQSLLGSILSKMLLVPGCAFFLGGIVHSKRLQFFNKEAAGVNSRLILISLMGILFPTMLHYTHSELHSKMSVLYLSKFISFIMLVAYAIYLPFQLNSQQQNLHTFKREVIELTKWEAIVWLFILTEWLLILSIYLIDVIQGPSESLNIPETFVAVVLFPIVEHTSAIMSAINDKLDVALEDTIGSAVRLVMFVMPWSVLVGWCMGKEMDLNFQLIEIAALVIPVIIVAFLLQEGTSDYFRGLMLILCYLNIAASFWFM